MGSRLVKPPESDVKLANREEGPKLIGDGMSLLVKIAKRRVEAGMVTEEQAQEDIDNYNRKVREQAKQAVSPNKGKGNTS